MATLLELQSQTKKAILDDRELFEITGYKLPCKQLQMLKNRGFTRAYRDRNGSIVLERQHYEAVCRGDFDRQQSNQTSGVNVGHIKHYDKQKKIA